jgi:hypothetical protein
MRRWARRAAVALAVGLAAAGANLALDVPAPAAASAAPAREAAGGATVGGQGRDLVREPASFALGVELPIFEVASERFVPPGFRADARQAIIASEHNPRMLAIHARQHPLRVVPLLWLGREWLVDFYYQGRLVAQTNVSRDGRLTHVWTGPLAQAEYAQGDFAVPFGRWWVIVPFSLLFLLPFLDLRRLWRLAHLDALAILAFLLSYLLFDHAALVAGVWAAYPPLAYLLARMLWLGWGGLGPRRGLAGGRAQVAPLLPTAALAGGLAALVAARIALSLLDRTVADVGYASVIGAHQIAAGAPLYFKSAAHGDTYGPVAYLAYLPFELLFPWHGAWDYLPSAHAASLCFDLVTVGALVALGRRLRGGQEGWRLGLALGWAWAACPFTLLALMMHTNDGLIAMLAALSLLAFSSPAARGALLGLGAAAKFAPAALLGLYAGGERPSPRGALICAGSFAAVAALAVGLYLPAGGVGELYRQTLGFQLHRSDVFSPWALHPALGPLQTGLEAGALGLAAALALWPRRRTLAQIAAFAAALQIAVQLPAVHWFYYYIVWFAPFALVAMLAPPAPSAAAATAQPAPTQARAAAAVGELVGA